MPKIPTFTSKARPTAEVGSVQSDIKIDPTKTVASALSSIAGTAEDYYIKKRNAEEELVADNILKDLEFESDKIVQSQIDNIVEEDSVNNYKQRLDPILQQKLSTINNKRIKQLVQSGINLNNTENIYNLRTNSFKALEKGSIANVNSKITSLTGKYATTTNLILKEKYRTQTEIVIKKFSKEFDLPANVLEEKLKASKKDFLLADMNQFAGTINGEKQIKDLDNITNGTKFMEDEDFGAGIFNAYNRKISELTIKGDVNADYERAIELAEVLEKFKRSNGYKVSTGELSVKIDSLKEKILTEKIQHEGILQKQGDNKLFYEYSNDLRDSLVKDIADPSGSPELQDRLASAEIESEYNQEIKSYLISNSDQSLENKKSFSRSLIYTLRNIYEDRNLSNANLSILDQNRFDIEGEFQRVLSDTQLLKDNKLDEVTFKRYKILAKINGFFIEKTEGKNEDGSPKITKIADVNAFINEYLLTLKSQISIADKEQ